MYRRLVANHSLLREECIAAGITGASQGDPVIIDEVQKIPELLDEVHPLIERRGIRYELHPLVSAEIANFSLERALDHGLLPTHYLSDDPSRLLQAYVGDYLREEIVAEAATRNLGAFSRFLEIAALSNGSTINSANIARECGVSAPTVRSYFEILEATLIGRFLPAFGRVGRRRLIESPRFYFFDVGITAALCRRGPVKPGSGMLLAHRFGLGSGLHSGRRRDSRGGQGRAHGPQRAPRRAAGLSRGTPAAAQHRHLARAAGAKARERHRGPAVAGVPAAALGRYPARRRRLTCENRLGGDEPQLAPNCRSTPQEQVDIGGRAGV